ncbi:MAG: hypothetical protein JXK07_02090 [Spirochaetes bacterium]|nr:hypothetical protein [Spirochaetota bacterium]MBN2771843.1 hypothetical protein [Spirochaetota bacterium]
MKSDTTLKHEGFQALRAKLDPVELERFIVLLKRESFDYTKWRKNIFEDNSIEELAEKADQFSQGLD